MFEFIKNIFKRKTENKKTSVEYDNRNIRYLKLPNESCAIILHKDNNVEVVFSKFYNKEQVISENEETLMALALFMQKPGFLETVVDEFRKIAELNITNLTEGNNR